jgi:phage major head subunit gpT-like protein
MIINKATLDAVFKSLNTLFHNAFTKIEPQWQKIAMLVPSTTKTNDYKWLGKIPKMRKWIGEKQVDSLSAHGYSITNDDFEVTVEVDRNDIDDDQLGIYKPQAEMAGESAAQLPDEIVADLVNGAFTLTCFDGQYFCDTDHPVGEGVVSNKITTAFSIATLAAAKASYGAARTAMRGFKDEHGRPLGIRPNVLCVGPALEDEARTLMTADRLEDGKVNIYKGTAEVVVLDRIDSATAWFLLDTTKPVKPFIYQQRKAPVFVKQTDPESDDVFSRKTFKFGAEARCAGGYGFWQLCMGSTGAG